MISCPIKECGRKFQNDETMLEHVRRRHPNEYNSVRQDATKSLIQKQHAQQQQLNKLPRLAKVLSKQVKPLQKLVDVQKRSSSKTRKLQSANLSTLIQQSRLTSGSSTTTNRSTIATRRPSLNKKVSSSDLRIEKLPPIQSETKKSVDLQPKQKPQPLKKVESNDLMYSTMPDFKGIGSTKIKQGSQEQKKLSKDKQKKSEKISIQKSDPVSFRSTMTILTKQKGEQPRSSSKKGLMRPMKKIEKKGSYDKIIKQVQGSDEIDFDQKIVTIKSWSDNKFVCPNNSKVQLLFVNYCGLHQITLNNLESLIQISVTHNKLTSLQFLNYKKNHNLRVVHVDHNQIQQFYSPPKVKILTASFNNLKSTSYLEVSACLKKSPQIQQIDLSFNEIRKTENYKLKILSICPRLKHIDGLKVTKIDIEMMEQFIALQSKYKGLIPLGSPSQQRPTTAISQAEQVQTNDFCLISKTIAQLEKEQKDYEKMISQTEQQLKVIRKQNEIINSQLEGLKHETKQMTDVWESANLLQKLQKQCEFLQLLNIMQYADEEELLGMIATKKKQLGLEID